MRKYRWAVFFFLFFLVAETAGGGVVERNFLLEISEEASRVISLVARFEQRVPLTGTGVVREAGGILYFLKGKGSRWEYESPAPQTYVVKGESVFFREGEAGKFLETHVPVETLTLLQSLIGGRDSLERLFSQGRGKVGGNGTFQVELLPAGDVERVANRVVVTWDERERIVREVAVYSAAGMTNLLTFQDVKKNVPVSPILFEIP